MRHDVIHTVLIGYTVLFCMWYDCLRLTSSFYATLLFLSTELYLPIASPTTFLSHRLCFLLYHLLLSHLPLSYAQPSPHSSLYISSSFLLLDAIFGSDSGQMYRSSVPFRANDPLLQVPYPPLNCSTLHCSACYMTLYYTTACYTTLCYTITHYYTLLHTIVLYSTLFYCLLKPILRVLALIYTATTLHSTYLLFYLLLFSTFLADWCSHGSGNIHTHASKQF